MKEVYIQHIQLISKFCIKKVTGKLKGLRDGLIGQNFATHYIKIHVSDTQDPNESLGKVVLAFKASHEDTEIE